jgi:glycosyltransferase involved in cell wall biosynthesis
MTNTAISTTKCSHPDIDDWPLLVFADDWGKHPSSCQHLIGQMLSHRRVAWVNTIGMRPPRFDKATAHRVFEKLRHWTARPVPASNVEGVSASFGPHVLNPRMWPWISRPFDRRLNRRLLLSQLDRYVKSLPTLPVVVTTIPVVADLLGSLPALRWVYYCVDDFSQWPGLDGLALQKMEASLIEQADLLIAASETLRDRIRQMGREAHLLTHGVDLDYWSGERSDGPRPELFEGLELPLIVFWGLVDRRMDLDFLGHLASDLDRGTILLIGPEGDPDPAIRRLDRIVLQPKVSMDELPRIARHADILIMPYADLPVTRAMQPLKLKEYLATGRPVVVRDLPSTRPWADCLDLARSPEAFAMAVRKRLERGASPGQTSARARLAEEGWAIKALCFERWIFGSGTGGDDAIHS